MWLLKIDDDSVAKLETLETYLKDNFANDKYLYMGAMRFKGEIHRTHEKWPEPDYKKDDPLARYPPYANGCCGYVLSNKIVRYIGNNADNLFNYHNEDTAVGIWIEESGFMDRVKYVDETKEDGTGKWFVSKTASGFFCNEKEKFKQYLVLGHQLKPSRVRQCYNVLFDKKH